MVKLHVEKLTQEIWQQFYPHEPMPSGDRFITLTEDGKGSYGIGEDLVATQDYAKWMEARLVSQGY